MADQFYIYILANARQTLYVGVTNNLIRRIHEHKNRIHPECFTAKYNVTRLVYFEFASSSRTAIIREKQLKNLSRAEKLRIIYAKNPDLRDLYEEICGS